MVQARPSKNSKEQWLVTNTTKRELAISDVLSIPAIRPGRTIDLLRYATREQISYSNVLTILIKRGWLTSKKIHQASGDSEPIDSSTADKAFLPRQNADNYDSISSGGGSSTFEALTDTNITSISTDDFLKWDGTDWINQTAAEAGIVGIPDGGSIGQILEKIDGSDYNVQWSSSGAASTTIAALTDTTITGPAADDLLIWDGVSAWVDKSFSEAGISAVGHSHSFSEITGTLADGDVIETNVTQHEAAIDHNALTNFVLNKHIDHSSITLTAGVGLSGGGTIDANMTFNVSGLTSTEFLSQNISQWTNDSNYITATLTNEEVQDIVANLINDGAGLSWTYVDGSNTLTGNVSLVINDILDIDVSDAVDGEVLVYIGGSIDSWVNQTISEAGLAADSHTHSGEDITSGTVADIYLSSNVGKLDVGALWTAAQQFDTLSVTGVGGRHTIASERTVGGIVTMKDVDGELPILTDGSPLDGEFMVRSGDGYISRDIVEADVSDLQSYLLNLNFENINDLADVEVSSPDDGEVLTYVGGSVDTWISSATKMAEIRNTVDGGGSETTAIISETVIEQSCNLLSASIHADVSGSIVATIKRDRVGPGETTMGTVTLSSAQTIRTTDLSGFTSTDLVPGDILIIEWGAGTTVTRAVLTLGRESA